MEKQKITVRVAGKNYNLVSGDPPEYLRRVASLVDRKLSEAEAAGNLPAPQVAVLACFNLADDLIKARDENRVLRRQLDQLGRAKTLEAKEKQAD